MYRHANNLGTPKDKTNNLRHPIKDYKTFKESEEQKYSSFLGEKLTSWKWHRTNRDLRISRQVHEIISFINLRLNKNTKVKFIELKIIAFMMKMHLADE